MSLNFRLPPKQQNQDYFEASLSDEHFNTFISSHNIESSTFIKEVGRVTLDWSAEREDSKKALYADLKLANRSLADGTTLYEALCLGQNFQVGNL